jgi:short-subunit dehydrogenase
VELALLVERIALRRRVLILARRLRQCAARRRIELLRLNEQSDWHGVSDIRGALSRFAMAENIVMSAHRSRNGWIAKTAICGFGAWWIFKKSLRHSRRIDLEGRTVLITGGSRGLGLGLAREFMSRGARVAICARDPSELERAKADLAAINPDVHTFVCDLRDSKQIVDLIHQVESGCGPIDMLVNNAGTIIVGPGKTMTAEDFQQAMAVNFWAAVQTSLAVIPQMTARGFGRIVNVGSIGGKMPVPHLAPYCASKFALVGFSASLRTELAKDGVLVTTVNPGLMRTGSPRNALFKGKTRAEYAWFSIADSLPGLSMNAASAARRIVDAAVHGEAEVTLGWPAKVAATTYGLFPNLQAELTALASRAFPRAGADSGLERRGRESESWVTRSFLRYLGKRAEREYNQV